MKKSRNSRLKDKLSSLTKSTVTENFCTRNKQSSKRASKSPKKLNKSNNSIVGEVGIRASKRLISINKQAKGEMDLGLESKLSLALTKKYPTNESREEKMKQLCESKSYLSIESSFHFLIRCSLETCSKPFKEYESKQILNHLATNKHKLGLAKQSGLDKEIVSPLLGNMTDGEIFLINLLTKAIILDQSFNSLYEGRDYEDSRYKHLITSVASLTQYIPVLYNYCLQGVKKIINGKKVIVHIGKTEEQVVTEEFVSEKLFNLVVDSFIYSL